MAWLKSAAALSSTYVAAAIAKLRQTSTVTHALKKWCSGFYVYALNTMPDMPAIYGYTRQSSVVAGLLKQGLRAQIKPPHRLYKDRWYADPPQQSVVSAQAQSEFLHS